MISNSINTQEYVPTDRSMKTAGASLSRQRICRINEGRILGPSLLLVILGLGIAIAVWATVAQRTSAGSIAAGSGKAIDSGPLAQTPSQFDQAIDFIEGEAEWMASRFGVGLPREFWYATSSMNFAQSRLRPARYSRIKHTTGDLPKSSEECLELGAGICGDQIAFFIKCMDRFDVEMRRVEFYNRRQPANHVVAEVFYDGKWRLFDVTWGTVYRESDAGIAELMSAEDLFQADNPRALAFTNSTDIWFQLYPHYYEVDPLGYLSWPEKDVITGGAGTINLDPEEASKTNTLRYVPSDRPNYFGSSRPSELENLGSLTCALGDVGPNNNSMTIDIIGFAGRGAMRVQGRQGSLSVPFDELEPGLNEIDLSTIQSDGELLLTTEASGEDGIAYVVFRSIELRSR
ncbi:MAG: transglutaminase domain-containing protein [Planctomycetes bacterium]|nr:transglutaminase domain-containing protein [Planctomycetota bacterium]